MSTTTCINTLLFASIFVNYSLCYKINLSGANTLQSSTAHPWASYKASNAVDGDWNPNVALRHCTHTNKDNNAWWRVKLSHFYVVESVRLFNRNGAADRLSKFNIRVGNASAVETQQLCQYYNATVPEGSSSNITCNTKCIGQYVSVQLTKTDYLTLCEVEVNGYRACTQGYYHDNCRSCNCQVPCHMDSGFCPGKCIAGKKGTSCQEVCDDKTWGIECNDTCMCKDTIEVCNKTNGHCNSGCKQYNIGPGCIKRLPHLTQKPSAKVKSSTSIRIMWETIKMENGNQLLPTSFRIQYRDAEQGTWNNGSVEDGSVLNSTVSGLTPNMKYVFRVVPISEYEGAQYEGQPTPESIETKTKCQAPVIPSITESIVECDKQGNNIKLHVSWERLDPRGHRCKNWTKVSILYAVGSNLTELEVIRDVTVTSTSVDVTDRHNDKFEIGIRVYNDENIFSTSTLVTGQDKTGPCTATSPGTPGTKRPSNPGPVTEKMPTQTSESLVLVIIMVVLIVLTVLLGVVFLVSYLFRRRQIQQNEMHKTLFDPAVSDDDDNITSTVLSKPKIPRKDLTQQDKPRQTKQTSENSANVSKLDKEVKLHPETDVTGAVGRVQQPEQHKQGKESKKEMSANKSPAVSKAELSHKGAPSKTKNSNPVKVSGSGNQPKDDQLGEVKGANSDHTYSNISAVKLANQGDVDKVQVKTEGTVYENLRQ